MVLKKFLQIQNLLSEKKRLSNKNPNFFSTLFQKTKPYSEEKLIKYNNWAIVVQIINAAFQIALVRKSSYKYIAKFFNLFRKKENKKEISDPPNWKFGVTREYIPEIKKGVADEILKNIQVRKNKKGIPLNKDGKKITQQVKNYDKYTEEDLGKMVLEGKFANGDNFKSFLNTITIDYKVDKQKKYTQKADSILVEELNEKLNDKPNADSGILIIFKGNAFDSSFDVKDFERKMVLDFEQELKSFDNGNIPFVRLSNYPFNGIVNDQVKLVRISKDLLETQSENSEIDLKELFADSDKIKILLNKVKVKDNRTSSNRLETKCLGKVPVAETMALFSLLTAVSHLVISTRPNYKRWIFSDQINYLRWLEYSITSSIMVLGLSGLCGITQSEELVPIAILTGVTNIFGLAIESIKNISFISTYPLKGKDLDLVTQTKYMNENFPEFTVVNNNLNVVKKILFITACITHSYPWARILFKLNSGINSFGKFDDYIKKAKQKDDDLKNENEFKLTRKVFGKRLERFSKISPLIKAATWGLAAIYWVFPINMINQQFRSKVNPSFKKYYQGELNYIIISMIAKSFLTWIIWSGSLRDGEGRADLNNCE